MCPWCEKQEESVYFSGADVYGYSYAPGTALITVYEATSNDSKYPKLELRRCITCDSLWFVDLYYPDHPPLILNAIRLTTPTQKQIAKNQIIPMIEENMVKGLASTSDKDTAIQLLQS